MKIYSKKILSLIIAVFLTVNIIPMSLLTTVNAVISGQFKISFSEEVNGDNIEIKLTSEDGNQKTATLVDNVAVFENFVDSEKIYKLNVSGLADYSDYEEENLTLNSWQYIINIQNLTKINDDTDFPQTNTAVLRGRLRNEFGSPYTNGAKVKYTEVIFDNSEENPDNSEVNPDNSEENPDNSEVNPDNSEVNPDNSEVNPDNSEVNPDNSEVNPDNSEVNPDNSEVNPDNSEVNPDNSEVNPANSEVTSDNSEVNPDNSEENPDNSEVTYGDSGDVDVDNNGNYSLELYIGKTYDISITAKEEKYEPIIIGKEYTVVGNTDFGEQRLEVKTFDITVDIDENGKIYKVDVYGNNIQESEFPVSAQYGENLRYKVVAPENYVISEITVNAKPVDEDVVGRETFEGTLYYVQENLNIVIKFNPIPPEKITFIYNEHGTVDVENGELDETNSIAIPRNENLKFTAIANENYHIASIVVGGEKIVENDDNDLKNGSYNVEVDDKCIVEIIFEIDKFEVKIPKPQTGGTVSFLSGETSPVDYGGNITLEIKPYSGFVIKTVIVNNDMVIEPDELTSTEDSVYTHYYTIENITEEQRVDVEFVKISEVGIKNSQVGDYFSISNSINKFIDKDGNYVFVFRYNDKDNAEAKLTPNEPYGKLAIGDNSNYFDNPIKLYETTEIQIFYVQNKVSGSVTKLIFDKPIKIVFDNNTDAPAVNKTPTAEWVNEPVEISVNAGNENGLGLLAVRYSTDKSAYASDNYDTEITNDFIYNSEDDYFTFTIPNTESSSATYYVWSYNVSQKKSECSEVSVNIDVDNPTVESFAVERVPLPAAEKILNALTFGLFFNNEIEVTINVADDDGVSSGLNEVTLYSNDDNKVGTQIVSVNSKSVSFRMPIDEYKGINELSAIVTDNVGNESELTFYEEAVMLENTQPVISIAPDKNGIDFYTDNKNQEWFKTLNIPFNIVIEDKNDNEDEISGLNYVEIILNGESIFTQNFYEENIETAKIDYPINIGDYTRDDSSLIAKEGENKIEVNVVDNAQNTQYASYTVYIDTIKPQIENCEITEVNATENHINYLPWGIFYNDKINLKVNVADSGFSSGLDKVFLLLENGTEYAKSTVNADGTVTFAIPKSETSFTESVYLQVTDKVGNGSNDKMPLSDFINGVEENNLVIEYAEEASIDITFDYAKPKYIDASENDWYSDDVSFNVEVKENGTSYGIKSVEVKLNSTEIVNEKFGNTAKVTEWSDIISTEDYSNPGVNKIEVIVTSNTGNTKTDYRLVCIDKTNPEITGFNLKTSDNSLPMTASNFTDFGIFYNDKITLEISVDDIIDKQNKSSGLKSIILLSEDGSIFSETSAHNNKGVFSFQIPLSKISGEKLWFNNTLSVIAVDNVGNITGKNADYPNGEPVYLKDITEYSSNNIMIETVKPTIDINNRTSDYNSNGADWFNGDVEFTVTAEDLDSGIRFVKITMNDDELVNADFNKEQIFNEVFTVNTSQSTRKEDGSYTLQVVMTDNSGNITKTSKTVYKDDILPSITNFEFYPMGVDDSDGQKIIVQPTNYGFYFVQDTTVIISSADDNPSSGLKTITYYTVDINTGKSQEIHSRPNENGQVSFNIKSDFKGQIYAKVTDNVENTPENWVSPPGTIVENAAKHKTETHIEFSKNSTSNTDNTGLDLYGDDVTLLLTVTDTYSGLKNIEWSVEASYDSSKNQSGAVSIGNNSQLTGDVSGWNITASDNNLVTKMTKNLIISNNSNNIVVKVKMSDRAGNISENSITFSIDKTTPTISVSYDNNTSDSEFTQFYKSDRVATIVITERNFRPSDVVTNITNSLGITPEISSWGTSGGASDNATHIATIRYNSDGDYKFNISYSDNAGHSASSPGEDSFTIDKTLPLISVAYDNNSATNSDYFDKARRATITINERNFETGRIRIIGSAVDDGTVKTFPGVSSWSQNGTSHTATISYIDDARYTFDITYADKAGNNAATYRGDKFTIDKADPKLAISGVADKSANNKAQIRPVITFSDKNLNKDPKLTLKSVKGVDVSEEVLSGEKLEKLFTKSATANSHEYSLTFENFKDDGIYTLTAELTDLAGRTVNKNITFSVNRNGSTYQLAPSLQAINGKYVKDEIDVVITEINVNSYVPDTLNLKITVNGTPKTLAENRDYKVVKIGGSNQWSQYQYTVNKSLFTDDGSYSVILYSKDEAGNINDNTDEVKKAEISFGIDKTVPEITPVDIEQNKQYAVDEKLATFRLQDNLVLDKVTIYLNNQEIQYQTDYDGNIVKDGNYSFNITSANSLQNIRVVALDSAGNEKEFIIDDILVTSNAFVRWYYNKPLFIATIVVAVILLSLLGFVLVRIFRKKKSA